MREETTTTGERTSIGAFAQAFPYAPGFQLSEGDFTQLEERMFLLSDTGWMHRAFPSLGFCTLMNDTEGMPVPLQHPLVTAGVSGKKGLDNDFFRNSLEGRVKKAARKQNGAIPAGEFGESDADILFCDKVRILQEENEVSGDQMETLFPGLHQERAMAAIGSPAQPCIKSNREDYEAVLCPSVAGETAAFSLGSGSAACKGHFKIGGVSGSRGRTF